MRTQFSHERAAPSQNFGKYEGVYTCNIEASEHALRVIKGAGKTWTESDNFPLTRHHRKVGRQQHLIPRQSNSLITAKQKKKGTKAESGKRGDDGRPRLKKSKRAMGPRTRINTKQD